MAKWILCDDIALRGWRRVPYALYKKGRLGAIKLPEEDYFFLMRCDGRQDIPVEEVPPPLTCNGIIRPAKEGERWSEWQKPRYCDNHYFPKANWAITGKCNYNCLHCFMAADNAPMMQEFSREEWQKTIADLDQCGVQQVTLTGGEPLLHPDFMEIVREITRRGMEICDINTNGSLLTEEILDELDALGAHPMIKISFDGLGHHDWMRQMPGAETQAFSAIKMCKERGFPVGAQTCVHRGNLDTLYETAVEMANLGVDIMRIIRTTESPRWTENAGDACLDITEYYDRMLEFSERYAAAGLPMIIDTWQFLEFNPEAKIYACHPVFGGEHSFRKEQPVCRGNRGTIGITADGSLVPCNQMSGKLKKMGVHLGNLKEEPLRPLLQESTYMDTVCCTVDALCQRNGVCCDCEHLKLCAGGCRTIALMLRGDYLAPDDAKCLFFKEGYLQKIDEMFRRIKEQSGIEYRCIDDRESVR